MLGKLIKYDFKWINKTMYIYFIILFIVSIAVKIIESLNKTILIVIIDKIASGLFIACIISTVITCIMRIWGRFIENVYKDESYLTHTLPITKNQIFNSKVIASILSILLSSFVILVCISIVFLNANSIETIKVMYKSLVEVYNGVFAVFFVIGIVFLVFLEIVFLMMSGIFGIVIGHSTNNYKMIKSIIVGIISYGIMSTILLIVLSVASKFADFEIVTDGFPSLNSIKIMGITSIVMYLIYDLFYYFSAKYILNKGVNID